MAANTELDLIQLCCETKLRLFQVSEGKGINESIIEELCSEVVNDYQLFAEIDKFHILAPDHPFYSQRARFLLDQQELVIKRYSHLFPKLIRVIDVYENKLEFYFLSISSIP